MPVSKHIFVGWPKSEQLATVCSSCMLFGFSTILDAVKTTGGLLKWIFGSSYGSSIAENDGISKIPCMFSMSKASAIWSLSNDSFKNEKLSILLWKIVSILFQANSDENNWSSHQAYHEIYFALLIFQFYFHKNSQTLVFYRLIVKMILICHFIVLWHNDGAYLFVFLVNRRQYHLDFLVMHNEHT